MDQPDSPSGPNSPPTSAPAPPTLDADLPCLGCGYNLRGLADDPARGCPECGLPVAQTLSGQPLRLAPRRWLALLLIAVVAEGFNAASIVVRDVVGWPLVVDPADPGPRLACALFVYLFLFPLPPVLLGLREPGSLPRGGAGLRWLALIGGPLSMIALFLPELSTLILGAWPFGPVGTASVELSAAVAIYSVLTAEFLILRRAALRVPAPMLARLTRWVIPVTWLEGAVYIASQLILLCEGQGLPVGPGEMFPHEGGRWFGNATTAAHAALFAAYTVQFIRALRAPRPPSRVIRDASQPRGSASPNR